MKNSSKVGDVRGTNHPIYDPAIVGPQHNRSCKDLIFLLLFVIFWIGMFVVAALAIQNGNPRAIL